MRLDTGVHYEWFLCHKFVTLTVPSVNDNYLFIFGSLAFCSLAPVETRLWQREFKYIVSYVS